MKSNHNIPDNVDLTDDGYKFKAGIQLQHQISDEEFHVLNKAVRSGETLRERREREEVGDAAIKKACTICPHQKEGTCMWGGFVGDCPKLPLLPEAEMEQDEKTICQS